MTQTDQVREGAAGPQNATLNSLVDNLQPVGGPRLAQDNGPHDGRALIASTTSLLNTTSTNVPGAGRHPAGAAQLAGGRAEQRWDTLADTADDTTPLLRSIRPTTDNPEGHQQAAAATSRTPPTRPWTKLVPVLDKATDMLREARAGGRGAPTRAGSRT